MHSEFLRVKVGDVSWHNDLVRLRGAVLYVIYTLPNGDHMSPERSAGGLSLRSEQHHLRLPQITTPGELTNRSNSQTATKRTSLLCVLTA